MGLLWLLCVLLSLSLGAVSISPWEAIGALFKGETGNAAFRIMFYLRLPRVLGGALAGGALAVAGGVIQAVLGNPMASPHLLGVNAGGGLGAMLLLSLLPAAIPFLPLAAFVGSMAACLLVYGISAAKGGGRLTVILSGIAIGSILSAGTDALRILFPEALYDSQGFFIGGLAGISPSGLWPAAILILAVLGAVLLCSRQLDILTLGEDVALSLGVPVKRARLLWLAAVAALSGAAVSFAGLIGFVGLLVPHGMRRLFGGRHARLLPACALGGGILVLFCDLLGRVLFAPYELPVGLLLSLLGGPFFLVLILRRKGERQHD